MSKRPSSGESFVVVDSSSSKSPPQRPSPSAPREAQQANEEMAIAGAYESYEDMTMRDRVIQFAADERELRRFHPIKGAAMGWAALQTLAQDTIADLEKLEFDSLNQSDKVDHVLLRKYAERSIKRLEASRAAFKEADNLVLKGALAGVLEILEHFQNRDEMPAHQHLASAFAVSKSKIDELLASLAEEPAKADKPSAQVVQRATHIVKETRNELWHFDAFFRSYDPLYDWWAGGEGSDLIRSLDSLSDALRTSNSKGDNKNENDPIGEPIGEVALLAELEAEVIAYTPSDLLGIAESERKKCEALLSQTAEGMWESAGWKRALEYVKRQYVEPGRQPTFVRGLIEEGTDYVKSHDLVTVPAIAEKWKMVMISPEQQKISPFFLGGETIQVSYPTSGMSYSDKITTLRSNNKHFSRAVAFHEMIPGHHLQLYMAERYNTHRRELFRTPFLIEGWATYWELVLWDRGFFQSHEDKIGHLYWRLHRCARIVFSLNYQLGKWSFQKCVDYLIDTVGHERAAAEGEVRRTVNGDYGPLYQIGYLIGALQLYKLRKEVLSDTKMGEKEFNDRVLKANMMPIEMMRALLLGKNLDEDYRAQWRFYD
jgi:hypothetical protein